MSLQHFLRDNRLELIKRTRAMVANRSSPQQTETEMERGAPLFLSQLVSVLDDEQGRNPEQKATTSPVAMNADMARDARLHGQHMRQFGFTLEEVVRHYGDVCQAVTELAYEEGAPMTTMDFHTLNWCLDNAIACAVTSWNDERAKSQAERKGRRDRALSNLLFTAGTSFDALRSGRVGSGAATATATVIERCLAEMRYLLDDPRAAAD